MFFLNELNSALLRRVRLSRPPAARISGVVEESPGKLEYEVALFRESGPGGSGGGGAESPVDQAVPIGTKLQLRATIGADSGMYFGAYSLVGIVGWVDFDL